MIYEMLEWWKDTERWKVSPAQHRGERLCDISHTQATGIMVDVGLKIPLWHRIRDPGTGLEETRSHKPKGKEYRRMMSKKKARLDPSNRPGDYLRSWTRGLTESNNRKQVCRSLHYLRLACTPSRDLELDLYPDASLRDTSIRLRVAKPVRLSTPCHFSDPEDQVGPERRGYP
jgi:hypothetical protein